MLERTAVAKLNENFAVITAMAGSTMDELRVRVFSESLIESLGLPDSPPVRWAVVQSLRHLVGAEVDARILFESGRRILMNDTYIKKGMPVPEWGDEIIRAHIGVVASEVVRVKGKATLLLDMKFRSLSGITAGMVIPYRTSCGYMMKLFRSRFGLKDLLYAMQPNSITGMMLTVSMTKASGYVKWTDITVSEKDKEYNKELVNGRIKKLGCGGTGPKGCHDCHLLREQCRYAVR